MLLNRDVRYRVEGHEFLVKDGNSKAILNTDLSAVKRHEERLNKVTKELKRDQEIAQLKSDVGEIKDMLRKLLGQ